jgi:uncharacterized membrane protein
MSQTQMATARIGGHPIHAMLASFPIACFSGALVTDIAFVCTDNIMWSDFSDWLLAVGVVMAVLAAIAGIVDFVANRRLRRQRPAWPHALGNIVVLALAVWDNLEHTHDAWTSVMPMGLILSAATVLIMAVTSWWGSSIVYDERVGVRP